MVDKAAAQLPPARVQALVETVLVFLCLNLLLDGLSEMYQALLGSQLNGDIPGYLEGAANSRFFYDSGLREPVHVACLKLGIWLLGPGEATIRQVSAVASMAMGGAFYLLGRMALGRLPALLALFIFCVNPVVQFYGVSGMREPIQTCFSLLLAWAAFRPQQRGSWKADVLLGVMGALLMLTRIFGVALFFGAVALRWWQQRAGRVVAVRHAGVALLAGMALWAPDRLFRNDHTLDHNINFIRNLERYGTPGTCDTDPPMTFLQYVFEDRTIWDVLVRVVSNHGRYVTHYLAHYLQGHTWLLVLLPFGLVAVFLQRRAYLLWMGLLALAPAVFILNVPQVPGASGVEQRLVYQVFPFALLVMMASVAWLRDRVRLFLLQSWPGLAAWWPSPERAD